MNLSEGSDNHSPDDLYPFTIFNLGGTAKKKTVFFGNFSQMADPTPPFWEPLSRKKILGFILHFRP